MRASLAWYGHCPQRCTYLHVPLEHLHAQDDGTLLRVPDISQPCRVDQRRSRPLLQESLGETRLGRVQAIEGASTQGGSWEVFTVRATENQVLQSTMLHKRTYSQAGTASEQSKEGLQHIGLSLLGTCIQVGLPKEEHIGPLHGRGHMRRRDPIAITVIYSVSRMAFWRLFDPGFRYS